MTTRQYTPVLVTDKEITLVIKKYPTGKVTPWIHSLRALKDRVRVKGFVSKFDYRPRDRHYVMIGAGTGITPLYALMVHLLANHLTSSAVPLRIHLIYASRGDFLLVQELKSLMEKHEKGTLTFHWVSSIQESGLEQDSDDVISLGTRVDHDFLKLHLPEMGPHSRVLICGPDGFNESVRSFPGLEDAFVF